MELERCYSVLAVSSSQKFNESIRGLLPESRYFPVTVMRDAASARRELLEQSYDLVIINAPLTDEFGTRLALDVCDHSGAGVLLMVKAEHYPDIEARVTPRGVLALSSLPPPNCLPSRSGCCASPGSGCGAWRKRPPPLRRRWRRSAW